MGWSDREGMSLAAWAGTLETLEENLDGILITVRLGKEEGIRKDILCLEAFDELDRYLSSVKRDLGI
jgi:hypothetical protein